MKQVVQNYRTGEVSVVEVPVPACRPGTILVKNLSSIVSMGTERSIVELGKKSLLGKARARPDLVKRVIEKARTEGVASTFREAKGRLETPTKLGYSSAGMVVECAEDVTRFAPGDRVACIGAAGANHAEYITVAENLAAPIPDGVAPEQAAFGQIAIVALHGVRMAELGFGARVGVVGLGLLGLLTVQFLRAYGCVAIGMDPDKSKCELARKHGAEIAVESADALSQAVLGVSDGAGADAVIIAAASESGEPLAAAAEACRAGGRIVIVGVTDIHPDRQQLWDKEIELVVSKAGGPGFLVPQYEEDGVDYPLDLVRWTQNRNLGEYLRLLAAGAMDVSPFITHRMPIAEAATLYEKLGQGALAGTVAVAFEYPEEERRERSVAVASPSSRDGAAALGVIGAGLFGRSSLLPALGNISEFRCKSLATQGGVSSENAARKYGFENATTDTAALLGDDEIDAVIVLTPHADHAELVLAAIEQSKSVLVEKPLCVTPEELARIETALAGAKGLAIMVGHNRRHSSHTARLRAALASRNEPLVMAYRINAGFVPSDHWVHAPEQGRSRVVGEMSHFVDLMQYLCGADPVRIFAERVSGNDASTVNNDNIVATIKFADGSVGELTYAAAGSRSLARESLELFWQGNATVTTDFRRTQLHGKRGTKKFNTQSRDLGYAEELKHFARAARGREAPIASPSDMLATMRAVFAIERSLATGQPVLVAEIAAPEAPARDA